jgi:hypothetical protein
MPAAMGDLVADFDEVAFAKRLQRRSLVELEGEAASARGRVIPVRFRVQPVEHPEGPALLIEGIDESNVAATRAMFEEYVKLWSRRRASAHGS